jgi:hypothetical protein
MWEIETISLPKQKPMIEKLEHSLFCHIKQAMETEDCYTMNGKEYIDTLLLV